MSGKNSKLDAFRQIRCRLYDLIEDLDRNEITKSNAAEMRAALKDVKTHHIVRTLRDLESPLSKSIPVDLLRQHENGRAHLEIIDMVRGSPAKKPGKIDSVMSLVENITQNLSIDENSIDQNNIADIMPQIMASIQQQFESGALDQEALKRDAEGFMANVQNMPAFAQLMSDPSIAALMSQDLGQAQIEDNSTGQEQ